jgi:hypothetical protein
LIVLLNLFSIGTLKVLCFEGFLDTRSPREKEINGVHCHFIERSK